LKYYVKMAFFNDYNPFNPETWIPYQLHESGEVVIRIHNVAGELVREFSLGYKSAGQYMTQDRSAYWDGRNEAGERVSSGVYFYNIQAGNYNATMKMIVKK
jgi:flagellar hook assembly protein FlgD